MPVRFEEDFEMKLNPHVISIPVVMLGLLLCSCGAPEEGQNSALTESEPSDVLGPIGQRLDEYLTRLEPFGFSGAVLVAREEQILLDRGFGTADRENRIPNTSQTIFQVGSITKQFTAAAIMQLVETGAIQTSDALTTFFEDLPPDKRDITLHQLLTHTSGVIAGDTTYFEDNSRQQIVDRILHQPLEFDPGSSFLYSNMGYALLAAVIEQVSGERYETYLRSNLFLPAGMEETGYRLGWDRDRVAHWYAAGVDNGDQLDRLYPDWNFIGSGRIRSTTRDMYRWHRALMSDSLLSEASKEAMYSPVENDYAYGWVVRDSDHGRLIQHNGASSDGAAADFRRYVDEDLVIVAFCNSDGEQMLFGNRLARHIDALSHGVVIEPPPRVVDATPGEVEAFGGLYETDNGQALEIAMFEETLIARLRGQEAIDAAYGSNRIQNGVRMSQMAQAALHELIVDGQSGPFGRLLVDPAREQRLSGFVLENRSRGEAELGAFSGLEVLGTTEDWVSSIGSAMTIVRLDFQGGSRIFRLHWQDENVLAVGGSMLAEPAEFWLQPTTEPDRFGGYHLPTTSSVEIDFKRDPDGAIMAAELRPTLDHEQLVFLKR